MHANPLRLFRPPHDLSAHPLRRTMLELVQQVPGLTLGELAHALGVDFTTVRHHARRLDDAGEILLLAEGRRRACYLPTEAARRREAPRILRALAAVGEGAATPARLARAMGVARGTAGSLLDALARRGFVERLPDGYRLTDRARAALAPAEAFSRKADFAAS